MKQKELEENGVFGSYILKDMTGKPFSTLKRNVYYLVVESEGTLNDQDNDIL